MKRNLLLITALLLLSTAAFARVTIVSDGVPRAVIVIAESPTDSAKRAADELQHFVELMSGAKLPIQNDIVSVPSDKALLIVGRSKFTSGMDIPAGNDREFSREGFVLKTRGSRVILAGNEFSDINGKYHGTEYAVYELLERLGCRWYFPGEYGQVVPKLNSIEIPDLDITQRPSFTVRNIWPALVADITGDMEAWLLRNKAISHQDRGFAFPGDGSVQNIVPLSKYAKQHPEIYAMNKDGKRQDESTPTHMTMPCMSSEKAVELAAKSISEYFRAHPEANSYGFSAPDAAAVCYCPHCSARMHDFTSDKGYPISSNDSYSNFVFRSISDPYFNFVNNVAWEVNKTFPEKYIVTLAYATRVIPPEGLDKPWNKNIVIYLAQYLTSAVRPIGTPTDVFALRNRRILEGWSRIAPKILMYEYDPHADLSRMPYWRSRAIARDMQTFHKNNVVGFATEGNNTFFRTGLNYYMRTRLMWDVNGDPGAILSDFYANFFGPAAGPMRQFCESIENMLQTTPDHIAYQPFNYDWTSTYPPEKIAALAVFLNRADTLANTLEVRKRLAIYRILHNYMTAYSRVYSLQHAGQYREALRTLETLPKFIAAAQQIQPGLMPPDVQWMTDSGMNFVHLKNHLTSLADKTDGEKGELLGRAPRRAEFLPDPKNIGQFEQWQRVAIGEKLKWHPIDLTKHWGLNGYRDDQGYAYDGIGWYRLKMNVKKPDAERAQLFVPVVHAEKIWVWVNGSLVASPSNMDADIKDGPTPANGSISAQAVRDNDRGYVTLAIDVHNQLRWNQENTITFRLQGTLERVQHRGISQIPFLWAQRLG